MKFNNKLNSRHPPFYRACALELSRGADRVQMTGKIWQHQRLPVRRSSAHLRLNHAVSAADALQSTLHMMYLIYLQINIAVTVLAQ